MSRSLNLKVPVRYMVNKIYRDGKIKKNIYRATHGNLGLGNDLS